MTTLDLMQAHPGTWHKISLDELASLVSNPDQVEIYRAATKQRFTILGCWQDGRLYTRFCWPSGKEKTFETRMAGKRALTEELELPVE
jgi:hypothetical protein